MITRIGDDGDFETQGCGCCATDYYLPKDRDKILEELENNIEVAIEGCGILGIDISDLVKRLNK